MGNDKMRVFSVDAKTGVSLTREMTQAEIDAMPKPPTATEDLAKERKSMVCTPLQGVLTLGETEWGKVITYRDTQATWAEKVVIDSALDWRRTSQNIAFFGYLLGYTDTQMDDLFRQAMTVDV